MNAPRPCSTKANGKPPIAPLMKNRFVGRVDRGNRLLSKHMLPQNEPVDADSIAVKLRIRFEIMLIDDSGFESDLL